MPADGTSAALYSPRQPRRAPFIGGLAHKLHHSACTRKTALRQRRCHRKLRCVPLPRAAAVTKPVTKPIEEVVTKPAVTKPNKGGRPRVGVEVMTVAERVARHRAKRRDGRVRGGGYSRGY